MSEGSFPVYRMYHNGHSFFKILSDNDFEEVKKMPWGYEVFTFHARILPDRNYIHDMLHEYENFWKVIDEQTYADARRQVNT